MPDTDQILLQYFSLYRQEIQRFLFRALACEQTTNDLLQDIYLRLVSYNQEQAIHNPRAFIYRIANNLAIDHLRAQHRQRLQIEEDAVAEAELLSASAAVSPDRVLEDQQQLQILYRAINQLTPQCKDVLIRSRFHGQTHEQIASDLGKSKSWVEKNIVMALRHCQQLLEESNL